MGLVLVVLAVKVFGFDVVPDPVGWVLVILGVERLRELPHAGTVVLLAGIALLVSALLWVPGVTDALSDADDSLVWAASLPQVAAVALLCASLASLAEATGDRGARAWLRTGRTCAVVTGVLPVLVYSGATGGEAPMLLAGVATMVLVVVLLFRYAARPWACPQPDQAPADRP